MNEMINKAIDAAESAQSEARWRDAADAFYTAAFLSEDDPKAMQLLLNKGDAALVRAELAEPPVVPYLAAGI